MFHEDRSTRTPYLIPEGNKHIGRVEEQRMLFTAINALHEKNIADIPSIFVIRGESGMGKTHLLQKVKEAALGFKGDRALGGTKEAILESGAFIQVPLFI